MDNHTERHHETPNVVVDYIRETETIRVLLLDKELTPEEIETLFRCGFVCESLPPETKMQFHGKCLEAPYTHRAYKEVETMFGQEHFSEEFIEKVREE